MKKMFIFIGLLSIACASLHAQNKTDIPVFIWMINSRWK